MRRLVWSGGVAGLVLAAIAALWLREPFMPPPAEEVAPPRPAMRAAGVPSAASLSARAPVEPTQALRATLTSPNALASVAPAAPPSPPRAAPVEEDPESSLATRLRRRIVLALRAKHPTEVARRDALLAEFHASGESLEPWTEQARQALERWREEIHSTVLPIRVEPAGCYAAGCLARATFPDAESYTEAWRRAPRLQLGEVGPHMQLPPEHLPSGEVVVSWAVLRPEAP